MKKLTITFTLALLLLSSFASAAVYDNFSGNTLDLSKWTERIYNLPFMQEHSVDTVNQVYHVGQDTVVSSGGSVQLIPTRAIQAGEVLEYDLMYNSGSGNNLLGFAGIIVNNGLVLLQQSNLVGGCSTPNPGCGVIGYWNGVPDVGNQLGIYHTKIEFLDNSIVMTTTRPDSSLITHTFTGVSAPYSPSFIALAGHNGLVDADYDNFVISNVNDPVPQDPPQPSDLELRVLALETAVGELQTQNAQLQAEDAVLRGQLEAQKSELQTQIDNHLADTSLADRVSTVETTLGTLQGELSSLWTAIETSAQNVLDELQPQLDNHEDRIKTLEKYAKLWERYGWFKNIWGR